MDLKEKLVSSFMAFENQVDVDSYVHDIRTEAIKTFETDGFPTKKDEAWWKKNTLCNNTHIKCSSSSSKSRSNSSSNNENICTSGSGSCSRNNSSDVCIS